MSLNTLINNKPDLELKTINWSEKVKELCAEACREIGDEVPPENAQLLISITTLSSQSIGPAIIYGENDKFLDVFVISPESHALSTAAVLKDNIQAVEFIGHAVKSKDVPEEFVNETSNPSYI